MSRYPSFGALVVSLDFELHWGVRDLHPPGGRYRSNLLGARAAIPRLLDLFEEFEIAATWATVGFLFARSKEELERHVPERKPRYRNRALDPYTEPVGDGEDDDPIHFAPSLIALIRARRGQEIGTHTFSHYYCIEPGQDGTMFAADLSSAASIAAEQGISLRSMAFPRNQCNPAYAGVLKDAGITAYRGNRSGWMYSSTRKGGPPARLARLVNDYVPVTKPSLTEWDVVVQEDGLANIPASCFLRSSPPGLGMFEERRAEQVRSAMRRAAVENKICHVWWHPHNLGTCTDDYLLFLRRSVLEPFKRLEQSHGMRSMSMADVVERVKERVEP